MNVVFNNLKINYCNAIKNLLLIIDAECDLGIEYCHVMKLVCDATIT